MWGLLSNPYSGGGKGQRLKNQVIKVLHDKNQAFYDFSGEDPTSARENLRLIRESDLQGLIVIGGDGTINMAVQSLAKSNVPLAVIPAGTGNDIARTLANYLGPAGKPVRVIRVDKLPKTANAKNDLQAVAKLFEEHHG